MNVIAIVRTYETLYVVDANLADEQIQAIMDKYRGVITGTGGEVIAAEKWDKRRLAYEVKGYREGGYILMYFSGEPAVAAELDRVMKLSEDVIRHLITREENGQADAAKERALRPAPAPAPAPAPVETVEEAEAPAAEAAPEAEAAAEPEAQAEAPAEEAAAEAPAEETEAPAEPAAEEPAESPEEPAAE